MIAMIPRDILLPSCAQILREKMAPIHYKDLASMACSMIGGSDEYSIKDIAEDLRGKGKGFPGKRYGMEYTGNPWFCVILSSWIEPSLFPTYSQPLAIGFKESLRASVETCMRIEHMVNKFNHGRLRRAEVIARGMMIEQHVKSWFEIHWPYLVLPPDNEGKYEDPCDHDFKLQTETRDLTVDVSGEKSSGWYGRPERKPLADIHVLARESGGLILIDGFVSRAKYLARLKAHDIMPVDALIFYGNCMKKGIPYKDIAKSTLDK